MKLNLKKGKDEKKKLFLNAVKVKKEIGVARQSKSSYSCGTTK